MRLERISITRPGTEFHLNLADFRPGFNLVYGTNGAGKSTTWNFLRDSLFGEIDRRRANDVLNGQVELTENNTRAALNWSEPLAADYSELTISPETSRTKNQVHDTLKQYREPLFRNLYFSCMRDQSNLQNLIDAARRDGISLESQSLTTSDGKWTLKNQLCPQDFSQELFQEERRLQELTNELESLERKFHQEAQDTQSKIRQNEQELQHAQAAVVSCTEELTRLQTEIKLHEQASLRAQQENCDRTTSLYQNWSQSFSDYGQTRQQLERAQSVLADLQAEETRLRDLARQSKVPYLQDAEQELIDSLQQDVRHILNDSQPCPDCGKHHLDSCDARWQYLRQTIREHSAQLTSFSEEHCSAHCQCHTTEQLKENQNQQTSLKSWIDQLQSRHAKLKTMWQELQSLSECQTAEQFLCGCSKHEAAFQRLQEMAHTYLDSAGFKLFTQLLEQSSLVRSLQSSLDQLMRQQKELLQKKIATEQEYQRLLNVRESFKAFNLSTTFELRLSELRSQIRNCEIRIEDLKGRSRSLQTTAEVVTRLRELEQQGMISSVLTRTSVHLCEHSDAKWRAVRINSDNRKLEALSAEAIWHPWDQLSCGTQQFISTMLRLSIAREYRRRGISFALVLDDVLADHDYEQQQSALQILSRYAFEGQQVIYLTCHQHVANTSAALGAHVQQISKSGQPKFTVTSSRSTVAQPMICAGKKVQELTPKFKPIPSVTANTQSLKFQSGVPVLSEFASEDFSLMPGDSISRLPQIGRKRVARLQSLKIHTIDQLLSVRSGVGQFCKKVGISPSRLRRWQATARLLCCTPGLKPAEARLLALCDIRDADTLATIEEDALVRRLESLRTSNRKSARAYSNHRYGRSHVQLWKRAANRRRSYETIPRTVFSNGRTSAGIRSGRTRHISRTTNYYRQNTTRSAIQSQTPRPGSLVSRIEAAPTHEENRGLKFYLSRQSDIVDAPSIGPKTARRLNRAGIKTVNDFLIADVEKVATKLNVKHITAQILQEWQAQARLVCCTPELRGHDAQILVACGVDDVSKLALQRPEELLEIVIPFSNSTQGKRILRSSKRPDLQEVKNWIQWSRSSRQLDAA
ncbi:DUF4332 domain-containing protein [Rubinisphaera sp.]|uniref:DUF4332 domain-containing protein n=1 Tax=Rubinisphaera sp. TaxID=2024857 RepID=UPI000C0EFBCB|nr:DUF4332 domain-containing protein [Rubinisphaera sp.]MBV07786.1 hypothetical protein [Rubinisphaera sp.]|tara:strand:- start:2922 stop:6197 length:3276 start_codon:yes stop_codon:yes gene_type:complete